MINILHIDKNHSRLIEGLNSLGYKNTIAYDFSLEKILKKIENYEGIVIRSRFTIDKSFIDKAKKLKFIARVGAGLENIDVAYAKKRQIKVINAAKGNSNAVGEHTLGMLLCLFAKLRIAHQSIQKREWLREKHRGYELEGKTIGIIGYGNMGRSFAKKLKGFNVKVICYDIKKAIGDNFAKQVTLQQIQKQANIISLHIPQTSQTIKMINKEFIQSVQHSFWLINTARGSNVVLKDLVEGLKNKKIVGAALDVLEYETSALNVVFRNKKTPASFEYLINAENVLLTPHVAGWSFESEIKMAEVIVREIKKLPIFEKK